MNKITVSKEIAGKTISIETGKIAKQTSGSVMVRSGDTMVLCSVVCGEPRAGIDFFPLMVEYQERYYASGKIHDWSFISIEDRNILEVVIRQIENQPKHFYSFVYKGIAPRIITS